MIKIATIQKTVAKYYRIPPEEMTSDRRFRRVARPRQVAMYLTKQLTPHSLPRIGRYFGDRDHTTIMHGIAKIDELRASDPTLRRAVVTLKRRLQEQERRERSEIESLVEALDAA